jgi:hypothetical protein
MHPRLRERHAAQGIAQLTDAHKKMTVATDPSAVRTAWSRAQCSIKFWVSSPALDNSVAMSVRFVGMMTRRG